MLLTYKLNLTPRTGKCCQIPKQIIFDRNLTAQQRGIYMAYCGLAGESDPTQVHLPIDTIRKRVGIQCLAQSARPLYQSGYLVRGRICSRAVPVYTRILVPGEDPAAPGPRIRIPREILIDPRLLPVEKALYAYLAAISKCQVATFRHYEATQELRITIYRLRKSLSLLCCAGYITLVNNVPERMKYAAVKR